VEQQVLLLRGNQAAPSDVRLNQSIEGLEYELASAIRKLSPGKRKRIGVLEGHGELNNAEAGDLIGSLQQYYDVFRVNLNQARPQDLKTLSAVIVAKPALSPRSSSSISSSPRAATHCSSWTPCA
jgi:ABC-2 type transport system permease protein